MVVHGFLVKDLLSSAIHGGTGKIEAGDPLEPGVWVNQRCCVDCAIYQEFEVIGNEREEDEFAEGRGG